MPHHTVRYPTRPASNDLQRSPAERHTLQKTHQPWKPPQKRGQIGSSSPSLPCMANKRLITSSKTSPNTGKSFGYRVSFCSFHSLFCWYRLLTDTDRYVLRCCPCPEEFSHTAALIFPKPLHLFWWRPGSARRHHHHSMTARRISPSPRLLLITHHQALQKTKNTKLTKNPKPRDEAPLTPATTQSCQRQSDPATREGEPEQRPVVLKQRKETKPEMNKLGAGFAKLTRPHHPSLGLNHGHTPATSQGTVRQAKRSRHKSTPSQADRCPRTQGTVRHQRRHRNPQAGRRTQGSKRSRADVRRHKLEPARLDARNRERIAGGWQGAAMSAPA